MRPAGAVIALALAVAAGACARLPRAAAADPPPAHRATAAAPSAADAKATPAERGWPGDPGLLALLSPMASPALFGVGVALVDLNGDGWPDLLVSNGNLHAPQPLIAYAAIPSRNGGFFGKNRYPDWISDEVAFHTSIAVGDIDGDGRADLVVAVALDPRRRGAGGALRIYPGAPPEPGGDGQPPRLRFGPMRELRTPGFSPLAVALGDFDGDGDLDVALAGAAAIDLTATSPAQLFRPAPPQLWRNDGRFALRPVPPDDDHPFAMVALDAHAADVDGDGRLDLVLAGAGVAVLFGEPTRAGTRLSARPGWQLLPEANWVSFGVDSGSAPDGSGELVVVTGQTLDGVSVLCQGTSPRAAGPTGRIRAYASVRPQPRPGPPVWSVDSGPDVPLLRPARIAVAELVQPGRLDLIVTQHGMVDFPLDNVLTCDPVPLPQGAPVLFFKGIGGARPGFQYCADAMSPDPIVAQGIAFGSLAQSTHHCDVKSETFPLVGKSGLFRLSRRRPLRIDAVTLADGRPLPADCRWAWVPNEPWLSLACARAPAAATIRVEYRSTTELHVAVASSDLRQPTRLFWHRDVCGCAATQPEGGAR
jgi:hypothetical protein